MNINNENWSPAQKMLDEMQNFDADLKDVRDQACAVPDFSGNITPTAGPIRLTLDELRERKARLVRLAASVAGAKNVLDSVEEAYHDYQEMFFENYQPQP